MKKTIRLASAKTKKIDEAISRDFHIGDEEALHEALLEILRNEKLEYGPYHYPNYAQILKHYKIRIIPLKADPNYTASIAYGDCYVNIGEGFLIDPETFAQLSVIVRHELCHNLMMHEIRMAAEWDKSIAGKTDRADYDTSAHTSGLVHSALNFIMDFEISNKKYTTEDKATMRALKRNGKAIKCLVTEDLRPEWAELTLEEMYHKLAAEIQKAKIVLIHKREGTTWGTDIDEKDVLFQQIIGPMLNAYLDKTSLSFIWEPIEEFYKKSKTFKKMSKKYQTLLMGYYELCKEKGEAWCREMLDKIVNSDPTEIIVLDPAQPNLTLHIPEEKALANNVLKYCLGMAGPKPPTIHVTKITHSKEYKEMYNEIIRKFGKRGEYTADEIEDILKNIRHFGSDSDTWRFGHRGEHTI